jgi:hypothetical protein
MVGRRVIVLARLSAGASRLKDQVVEAEWATATVHILCGPT